MAGVPIRSATPSGRPSQPHRGGARVRGGSSLPTATGRDDDVVSARPSEPGRITLTFWGLIARCTAHHRTYIAGALRRDGVLHCFLTADAGDGARLWCAISSQAGELSSRTWQAWPELIDQEGGRDIALPDAFGADLLINSRVPVGGGLSSSAALGARRRSFLELSCPLRPDCSETDAAPADNDAAGPAWLRCASRPRIRWRVRRRAALDRPASTARSFPGQALVVDSETFRLSRCGYRQHSLSFLVIDTPERRTGGYGSPRGSGMCRAHRLRFLRDALPEDLSCRGMDAYREGVARRPEVDSSVNRAGCPGRLGASYSFPRAAGCVAFHDMTRWWVARATAATAH